MTTIDEKLITAVQRFKILYDSSDKNYYNYAVKDLIWEAMANDLGETVDVLKKKWQNLRDCYRKALILRMRRKRVKNMVPWRYEKEMSFLKEHIHVKGMSPPKTRKKSEPTPCPNDTLTEKSPLFTKEFLELLRGSMKPPVEEEATESAEDVVAFFTSMGQKVDKLTPELKIEFKKRILSMYDQYQWRNEILLRLFETQDALSRQFQPKDKQLLQEQE